jgi:hypothetical protein
LLKCKKAGISNRHFFYIVSSLHNNDFSLVEQVILSKAALLNINAVALPESIIEQKTGRQMDQDVTTHLCCNGAVDPMRHRNQGFTKYGAGVGALP